MGGEPDRPTTELIRDPGGGLAMRVLRLEVAVTSGRDRGRTAVVDHGRLRVGTGAEADLVLTDPTVSHQHCELSVRGGGVVVVDHGSSNGTFVDQIRIVRAEVPPGTALRIGQTTLSIASSSETVLVPVSDRDRFGALLGTSARMRQVFAILERLAGTEATVLLEGESGTGKELAAEALHEQGPRADGPFVVFDAGAVARELVESTLFGHVRGAFTGAVQEHRGLFEEADGGTLFLDEIGELPLELQPKLLRALEKREVRPVGAAASRKVDVRIVAATNRSLEAEVNAGRFRGDLYFRLAVVRVELPPLRARPEDIPLYVQHFARGLGGPGGRMPSERALLALQSQPWPGNVRELRNAVERAISVMGVDALGAAGAPIAGPAALPYLEARDRALETFERQWLEAALARHDGNVTATAREMGVNRKRIQRMMRRLGMRD